MQESGSHTSPARGVDEVDRARAQEYALLATLLSRGPGTELIGRLALLGGDTTPLGVAHAASVDCIAVVSVQNHPEPA